MIDKEKVKKTLKKIGSVGNFFKKILLLKRAKFAIIEIKGLIRIHQNKAEKLKSQISVLHYKKKKHQALAKKYEKMIDEIKKELE